MRRAIQNVLLTTALSVVVYSAVQAQAPAPAPPRPTKTLKAVPNFVTATDAMMRAPKPEDWLMYRGNYQGWGYSPLEQINKTNVKSLQLAWSRAMEPGINQATPHRLQRRDVSRQSERRDPGDRCRERRSHLGVPPPAAAGRAVPERPTDSASAASRSMATASISVTWDNFVVALDARTGEQVWQTDRGGDLFVSNSSGPIVANGVVVAGSTCQVAGYRLLRHRPRRGDRRGAVAQRDDPAPGPAGRRDLGRRAVSRSAG